VVKANAYGHGLARVAGALMNDCDGFGILELDGAVELREMGFHGRILLLEGFFDASELAIIASHRLATVVHSDEQLRMLEATKVAAPLDVFFKINTGMNRLGFRPADFPAALRELEANPAVGSITLMTHFADVDDERGVAWQMETFERAVAGSKRPRSVANSAAVLRYPETHFDAVRPGIMLYGATPFAHRSAASLGLAPVMTLRARLIAVQSLAVGERVGYGGTFTADAPTRIGVVACGYGDGYPRHAPNGTPVLVCGRRVPTAGRVSMDMLTVDLTQVPEASIGSDVVLWGEGLPVDDVAKAAGTVGYELLCAVAPRVPFSLRESAAAKD